MRKCVNLSVAVLAVLALALSGCGSDSNTSGDAGATQSTAPAPSGTTGATSATGSTASTKQTVKQATAQAYNACLAAAGRLPRESSRERAQKSCQDAYGKAQKMSADVQNKVDDAVEKTRKTCEDNAKTISNQQARQAALEACKKVKQP